MLAFFPLTIHRAGLASALADVLSNHPIRRAYLGDMGLFGEDEAATTLLIEWTERDFPRDLAQKLSDTAMPFFEDDDTFNVAPVPPGAHWNAISSAGERVLERTLQ